MDISAYLNLMLEKNGESLIFRNNSAPILKILGQESTIGKKSFDNKIIQKIIFNLISAEEKQDLIKNKSLETTHIMAEKHHFNLKIMIKENNLEMIISLQILEIKQDEDKEKPEEDEIKPEDEDDEFLDLGMLKPGEEEEVKKTSEPEKKMISYKVLGKAPEGDLDILPYLKKMVEIDGSDLFLTVDSVVKAKVSGTAIPLDNYLLTPEMTRSGTLGVMNAEQIEEFERTKDLDFAIAMPDGSARFRANAFYQRRTVGLVMRLIPSVIPTAEQLNLPPILTELIMVKRGLLLMVGGTGSGKSTTLAAMINHRNANSPGHILTIEDPVEFSHPNLMSIVNQREIGVDTASYAKALKASLREAPDVILIGEIRDQETMEAGLELANTGHLCISTMHANNANQAMERIVNMFPQSRHKQLFMDIAGNLNAVVSQRLVKTKTGGRCAAIENMINTPHIATLILKGELNEIKDAMATSGTKGMKTFDDALFDLFKADKISLEEALANADSRNDLEAKLNFG